MPAPNVHSAMILCAGLGTRLRPLTDWLAKPMVPIGDRPAVAHIADHLRAAGLARIVVNVHHRPDDLRAWAASSSIAISNEPVLLGTAGGIANASSLLGEGERDGDGDGEGERDGDGGGGGGGGGGDVLVWNGDILAKPNLAALIDSHAGEATLAITPRPAGEGNVGLDADGRIVRLRKESFPALGEELSGGYFTGIHIVGASLRAKLPTNGCIVGDVYLPALRNGARLAAHVLEGDFIDVGSLSAYATANRAWLGDRKEWSAPSAVIHAAIDESVIGADAVIDAPTLRSIVWPGTTVLVPTTDSIVTPHGTVRITS